jgi:radical SAM protein with 4Fe4S-binding SPASM domain
MYIHPDLRWRWEGDKLLLNNLFTLNKTAGEVLELFDVSQDIPAVVAMMKQRYPEVDAARLQEDIDKVIQKLIHFQCLSEQQQPPPLYVNPQYRHDLQRIYHNSLQVPLGVACELTYFCGAHCLNCYCRRDSPDPRELTTEEWTGFLSTLADAGVFSVTFSGGCPFLRRDLENIVHHAVDCGLRVVLASDALMVNNARLKRIVDTGVAEVRTALDSASDTAHDTFRGMRGLHNRIVARVRFLTELNIPVQISAVMGAITYGEAVETIRLAQELGATRIHINKPYSTPETLNNPRVAMSPQQYIDLLKMVYKVWEETDPPLRFPSLPKALYDTALGVGVYEMLAQKGALGQCQAGIMGCSVGPGGEIKPCDVSVGTVLGTIGEEDFFDVWTSHGIFSDLRRINQSDLSPCSNCEFNSLCTAGCRALSSQLCTDSHSKKAEAVCKMCYTMQTTKNKER